MLETIKDRAVQRRKGDEGFTLIELLVVIVILAILAAIVVFAVGGIGDKGQDSACKTDLQTIQTAQEAFFAQSATGPSPSQHYAADATELKTAKLLTDDTNKYHTTGQGASPTAYVITGVGDCVGSDYAS